MCGNPFHAIAHFVESAAPALAGAALGATVPGLGTIAGLSIGGMLGGAAGGAVGSEITGGNPLEGAVLGGVGGGFSGPGLASDIGLGTGAASVGASALDAGTSGLTAADLGTGAATGAAGAGIEAGGALAGPAAQSVGGFAPTAMSLPESVASGVGNAVPSGALDIGPALSAAPELSSGASYLGTGAGSGIETGGGLTASGGVGGFSPTPISGPNISAPALETPPATGTGAGLSGKSALDKIAGSAHSIPSIQPGGAINSAIKGGNSMATGISSPSLGISRPTSLDDIAGTSPSASSYTALSAPPTAPSGGFESGGALDHLAGTSPVGQVSLAPSTTAPVGTASAAEPFSLSPSVTAPVGAAANTAAAAAPGLISNLESGNIGGAAANVFNDLKSSGLAGPALSLAATALFGNQKMPNQAQYQQLSAPFQQAVQSIMSSYNSGKLLPGQQAQLAQQYQIAQARIKNFYADAGQSESTGQVQMLDNLNMQYTASVQTLMQNNLSSALSAAGAAASPLNAMTSYTISQDQQFNNALTNALSAYGHTAGYAQQQAQANAQ